MRFTAFRFSCHHIDDLRQMKRAARRKRRDIAEYVLAGKCFAHLCIADAVPDFGPSVASCVEYARKIREPHIWAGEGEMLVMACMYKVQLYIVDVPGKRIAHGDTRGLIKDVVLVVVN